MVTGAALFVSTLRSLGIGEIFTLVGDHLNEVLAEAVRQGMRVYDFRHESGVTHAADAWARIHRKPAVSLVTGGPGHTNSLTGVATAHLAGSPLIAVSGSRSSKFLNRGAFQDIDQTPMARPVVKWAAEPSSATEIPQLLCEAWRHSSTPRMGATHLTIPVDLFTAPIGEAPQILAPQRPEALSPYPDDVHRLVSLLRKAHRPVILVGSGVWWGQAEKELLYFLERTSLPVFTITMARGSVPDEHPLCFGYADPSLNRAAWRAYQEADLVVVLGKRIDYRLALGSRRVFPENLRFAQVDSHAQELHLNRKLEIAIHADLRKTLLCLLEALGQECWPETGWVQRLRNLTETWRKQLVERSGLSGSLVTPPALFETLKQCLDPATLISWDGGDFVHWGRAIIPALRNGGWLRLGPLGTIGSALPNAIALQMAHPKEKVICITGDGALGFYIAELDTAVRYRLPIVFLVGNDAGWGLERELQREAYGVPETIACELRQTRYDIIMQGFGGEGECIQTAAELPAALDRAFTIARERSIPYLVNVNIQPVRSPFADWQIEGKKS